jgi:hypothetical protein
MAKEQKKTIAEETTQEDYYVSKLSVKALGCDPRLSKDEKTKSLCRIYGSAQGLKSGEDKNNGNVWTALQGKFEGVNIEQGSEHFGKTLRSGKLFLPAGIQDVIEGKIREIENTSGGALEANVLFGLEIRSVEASNRIGYSYEAKNLMPVKQQDDLAAMRQTIEDKVGKPKAIAAAKE